MQQRSKLVPVGVGLVLHGLVGSNSPPEDDQQHDKATAHNFRDRAAIIATTIVAVASFAATADAAITAVAEAVTAAGPVATVAAHVAAIATAFPHLRVEKEGRAATPYSLQEPKNGFLPQHPFSPRPFPAAARR